MSDSPTPNEPLRDGRDGATETPEPTGDLVIDEAAIVEDSRDAEWQAFLREADDYRSSLRRQGRL